MLLLVAAAQQKLVAFNHALTVEQHRHTISVLSKSSLVQQFAGPQSNLCGVSGVLAVCQFSESDVTVNIFGEGGSERCLIQNVSDTEEVKVGQTLISVHGPARVRVYHKSCKLYHQFKCKLQNHSSLLLDQQHLLCYNGTNMQLVGPGWVVRCPLYYKAVRVLASWHAQQFAVESEDDYMLIYSFKNQDCLCKEVLKFPLLQAAVLMQSHVVTCELNRCFAIDFSEHYPQYKLHQFEGEVVLAEGPGQILVMEAGGARTLFEASRRPSYSQRLAWPLLFFCLYSLLRYMKLM